ncbi:competence protein CoiA [Bacillus sp. FJAT-45037]|uniref:competence protein CoiA n=1 Tax=Bacillus sp. FJAT-45037 TaxID=2011007 RepID=UPI000C23E002|nr:competence protein CoiA family protein [Bacillus sp. FJAT-45037]
MLTAKLKDGSLFSMAGDWTYDQLKQMRQDVPFYCPCCQAELQLKLGMKKQWHFAHKKDHTCTVQSEHESLYHLQGKRQLYEWLKNQGLKVALEVYLPLIRQRPDLLFKDQDQLYALEYQCSPIDLPQLEKRTRGYKQLGMIPIWILGGNRLTRLGSNTYTIKAFEWYMNTLNRERFPQINYYCSEQKKWMSLLHTTPYSSNKVLASLHQSLPDQLTYSDLLDNFTDHSPLKDQWLYVKKNWRYFRPKPYPSPTERYFQQLLYHHRVPPSHFPIEAGWPTKSYEIIETAPHIWQSYFLFACLLSKPLHQPITISSILSCFTNNQLYRWLKLRPMYESPSIHEAVLGYLDFLVRIGFLTKVPGSSDMYYRLREPLIPTSTEEAIKRDAQLTNKYGAPLFGTESLTGNKGKSPNMSNTI